MELYKLLHSKLVVGNVPSKLRWYVNQPNAIFIEFEEDGERKHFRFELDLDDIEGIKEFLAYHKH